MPDEPKPRKGQRDIDWGSPRYYQEALRQPNPNSHPAKRKAGWCKKLKGPHQYGPKEKVTWEFRPGLTITMYERRCTGCGKKQTWRRKPKEG